jgi:hypothetical protein
MDGAAGGRATGWVVDGVKGSDQPIADVGTFPNAVKEIARKFGVDIVIDMPRKVISFDERDTDQAHRIWAAIEAAMAAFGETVE